MQARPAIGLKGFNIKSQLNQNLLIWTTLTHTPLDFSTNLARVLPQVERNPSKGKSI